MLRALLVAAVSVLATCAREEGRSLRWGVSMTDPAAAAQVRVVQARIYEGGCAHDKVVYESNSAPQEDTFRTPPVLRPGVYGFGARAKDRQCRWIVEGCTDVILPLPAGASISIPLDAAPGAVDCVDGACKGGVCPTDGNIVPHERPNGNQNDMLPPSAALARAEATSAITYRNMYVVIDLASAPPGATAFAIVTGAQHGTAEIVGTQVSYMPDLDYVGSDTFTYAVTDGTSVGEVASVSITVASNASCAAILATGGSRGDDVYSLDPDGAAGDPAFDAYCDMKTEGGGWTLALKANGSSRTFVYDAAAWTTAGAVNPSKSGFDHEEAKLVSFDRLSVSEVMLMLESPIGSGDVRSVRFAANVANLRTAFASGTYQPIAVGRAKWLALVANSSLQSNCNQEGFNLNGGYNKLRLGIFANNENDCASSDSRIGIGGDGCAACGPNGLDTPSVGGNDNGINLRPAFGWLFVR